MVLNPNPPNDSSKLIAARYRLGRFLGRGTFGEVYLANDIKFQPPRPVALKILHPDLLAEEQARQDFEREASLLARFNHPNILRVLDFGVSQEQTFIVTEYAGGGSLAQKLRPDPTQPPLRLSFEEAGYYLEQIGEALTEAHSQGLIHRDIKPQNILLDQRGRALVADFGLAAVTTTATSSSVATEASVSGTPLYMAPEQWQGKARKASDIYALGIILYQMLTGFPPYLGSQYELMSQHINAPVPRLSRQASELNYPEALNQLFAQLLAKDPQQRPRPAKDCYQLYKKALATSNPQGVGIKSHPTPDPEPTVAIPPVLPASPNYVAGNLVPLIFQTTPPPATPTRRFSKKALTLFGIELLVILFLVSLLIVFLIGNKPEEIASRQITASVFTTSQNTSPSSTTGEITLAIQKLETTPTPSTTRLETFTSQATLTKPGNSPTPAPESRATTSLSNLSVVNPSQPIIQTLLGHSDRVISVVFSPDGKLLASGSFDNSVKLWDVTTGKELKTLSGHTAGVRSVIFHPTGKWLVSSANDKTIRIWDIASGREVGTFLGHTAEVGALAFTPDGSLLVSGSDDTTLKVWDFASRRELRTLSGHSREVNSVAISPDGKTIASGGFDNLLKFWDLASGKELKNLTGHKNQIYSVAFSPTGDIVASASTDTSLKFWEVSTGKELKTLEGHKDEVLSVVFSPDGKTIASGGGNSEPVIRIWNVESGQEIQKLSGHSSGIRGLAISPDGKILASGSRDNTIKLWRING